MPKIQKNVIFRPDKFAINCLAPLPFLFGAFREKSFRVAIYSYMRKAIGFLIILWGLSHFLNQTFNALNSAAAQSFKTIEMAALVTQERLIQK